MFFGEVVNPISLFYMFVADIIKFVDHGVVGLPYLALSCKESCGSFLSSLSCLVAVAIALLISLMSSESFVVVFF